MSADDGAARLRLRGVVPLGVEVAVPAPHQLFLLALYVWDDHFQIAYAGSAGVASVRDALFDDDWEVVDDAGRRYGIFRAGGGGSDNLHTYYASFRPGLRADTRSLTVSLLRQGDGRLARHVISLDR